MEMLILTTKLHIPPSVSTLVSRSRLFQVLSKGLEHKLLLVSAPAGFGKTTAITSWLETKKLPVAWLSLDDNDSDLSRFMLYLISALQTINPNIGQDILPVLASSQPISIDLMLTQLVNDLTKIVKDFVIVLDDYHIIDSSEVDETMSFLLEHCPPQMHIVIATREDPNLPLARLRGRGQLTELRAADLRFTDEESTQFLNTSMGLELSPEHIVALEKRTEGWIVGLQLAALSLQPQQDTADFIESFTGSHHFVLDYLVEEVLNRQPSHIQNFLLKTSILNRLCASLCDAIIQDAQYPSQTLLRDIQNANLFLVSLDNERYWFRYHHLFADLLRKRLKQSIREEVNTLHILASQWFEQNNQRHDAIHHALLANKFDLAADLIELEWSTLHSTTFQSQEQRTWMEALPTSVYRNRPVLSAGYAWVLLNFGELDAADRRLRDAERWLDMNDQTDNASSEMIVIDETEFRRLPATIAAARAYHAVSLGNVSKTIKYGQKALALIDQYDHQWRGIISSLLGLAYWTQGKLSSAYEAMSAGMEHMHKLGNIHFALSSTFGLADVRLGQGRLRDAIAIYKRAIQIAEAQPYMVQGMADLYMGLGDLYREQNDLATAREYLLKSETLGKQAGLPDWRIRFCKIQARMKQLSSDFDEALSLLDEAERLYYPTAVPNTRPPAVLKAAMQIKQGDLHSASIWASKQGLSLSDEVNYLNEFELMTMARIHIAQFKNTSIDRSNIELNQLLDHLLDTAETDQRMGSVIEILILQAQLQRLQGNYNGALDRLEKSLILAESEGYVRIFVDEGEFMRELLSELASRRVRLDYVRRLLSAFNSSTASHSTQTQPLIEPLSDRELEILRLIAYGLSNREVSERLFIALNTVKGHNQNIYQKLQVKRRTEAVARAHELGLI